jgi:hypothetical protein
MTFLLLLALVSQTAPSVDKPWVPAPTDMEDQTCGPTGHRHSLNLDEHGHYVVNKEKNEPDIVFDGKCHDNNDEHVMHDPQDALPVPKPKNQRDL